jgi:triphosphoribosyl-dephospho-CoA synthase
MTSARSVRVPRAANALSPARIGRAAVAALHREAVLYPKPGLVSAIDDGAHADMSLATLYRSIGALRDYFPAIAALGAARASWPSLASRGQAAEAAMLAATGGVNTHRGAIFHLGLVCAAAGALPAPGARSICAFVRHAYAPSFRGCVLADSHGGIVARRHGAGGARMQAASGYFAVRRWSLPAYREALAATGDADRAAVQALFALIAHLDDTNLLWRGGSAGLAFAQHAARAFLAAGGVRDTLWRDRAIAVHRAFVQRGLSPGGSADLLAVTLLLHALSA